MLMWTLLALAAIPWLIFFRSRFGAIASLSIVTLGAPAILIALMMGARALDAPLGASIVTVVGAAGAVGWVLVVLPPLATSGGGSGRRRAALRSSTELRVSRAVRRDVAMLRDVFPAALGALVALASFVATPLFPSASRVSWAMLGDSASQLMYARYIIQEGGVAPPPLANPVPLTPAMVASVATPGRPTSGAGAMISHDIGAYASTWAALIVVSCLLAGALGYAVVKQSGRLVGLPARATVAATSLLPLGWFWTGYPIKFGFINAHVVFIVLAASILAYLSTRRWPGLGLLLQLVAMVLALLSWSPLAGFPAALGLAQALLVLRLFARRSRRALVVSVLVGLVGVGGALAVGIPMLLEASGALSIPGGLAEFPKPMLPAAAIILIATTLAASARVDRVAVGMIAISGASIAGLVAVLVLSESLVGPWSYYPHKYAWLATVVLLTIAFPQALSAAARVPSALARRVVYSGAVLVVGVSLGFGSWWAPGDAQFLRDSVPYVMLVEDNLPNGGQNPDTVANAVIARVNAQRLTIPWESSLANDYRAAFWLLHIQREEVLLSGDGPGADALWSLANFHAAPSDLCRLSEVVPEGVTVQTTHQGLAAELEALCPGADIIVQEDS